jgi:hypothetical protein
MLSQFHILSPEFATYGLKSKFIRLNVSQQCVKKQIKIYFQRRSKCNAQTAGAAAESHLPQATRRSGTLCRLLGRFGSCHSLLSLADSNLTGLEAKSNMNKFEEENMQKLTLAASSRA